MQRSEREAKKESIRVGLVVEEKECGIDRA